MTDRFSAQNGAVHIAALVLILVAIGVATWFFLSRGDSKVSRVPIEDKISSLQPKPFKDISTQDKNYKAIKYLAREGILRGDKDGQFNPQSTITRSAWVEMLVKLSGAEPNQSKYLNCYSDVTEGVDAAAICYAKEQGWLDGFKESTLNTFRLIKIVNAQEANDTFNPNSPVKNNEAGSSLSLLVGNPVENSGSTGNLTKTEAAGIVYKSLASQVEGQVERYEIEELVKEKNASEDEYTAFVKSQREKNYQALLEGDKTSGQEVPTFDVLRPLQQFVTAKAGQQQVSVQDIIMYKSSPPAYDNQQKTSSSVISARESANVKIFLDQNYRILTQDQWSKSNPVYVLNVDFHHFYNDGRAIGSVYADLVNFETGVIEQHYASPRSDYNRLNYMFNTAINGIESRIGNEIAPPAQAMQKSSSAEESDKDQEPSSDVKKGEVTCEQLKQIMGSKECPEYVVNIDVWCAQTIEELYDVDSSNPGLYRNRPPDYSIDHSSEYTSAQDCVGRE